MSSLVLLLLFLLCFSMNACNARQLRIIPKEPCRQVYLSVVEGVEEIELHESSIPSRPRASISEELETQTHHHHRHEEVVGKDERKTHRSWGGANMMKQKVSKAFSKEKEETKEATSGSAQSEIIISSSKEGLQQATQVEERKRGARSLLGSAAPHDADKTLDSKEDGIVEDIVVMDYAQPHRKPPIHNEEP